MHYQGNESYNEMKPDGVIRDLLQEFPDFAKDVDVKQGPYTILSNFAIYLRDGIVDNTINSDELNRAFDFLNNMGASRNLEVQNLLVVGVLEILADTDESTSIAKQKLKNYALESFERVLSGWNNA